MSRHYVNIPWLPERVSVVHLPGYWRLAEQACRLEQMLQFEAAAKMWALASEHTEPPSPYCENRVSFCRHAHVKKWGKHLVAHPDG